MEGGVHCVEWTTPMSSRPIIMTSLVGTAEESVACIRVSEITTTGFTVLGTYINKSGNISMTSTNYMWLAICQK